MKVNPQKTSESIWCKKSNFTKCLKNISDILVKKNEVSQFVVNSFQVQVAILMSLVMQKLVANLRIRENKSSKGQLNWLNLKNLLKSKNKSSQIPGKSVHEIANLNPPKTFYQNLLEAAFVKCFTVFWEQSLRIVRFRNFRKKVIETILWNFINLSLKFWYCLSYKYLYSISSISLS